MTTPQTPAAQEPGPADLGNGNGLRPTGPAPPVTTRYELMPYGETAWTEVDETAWLTAVEHAGLSADHGYWLSTVTGVAGRKTTGRGHDEPVSARRRSRRGESEA